MTSSSSHHDHPALRRPKVPLAIVAAVILPLRIGIHPFTDRLPVRARQDLADCRSHFAETFVSDLHLCLSRPRGRDDLDHGRKSECPNSCRNDAK